VLDSGKPYDGWTETVPLDEEITPQTLWQGILDLHELVAAGGPREALLPDDGAE
jgi:hypothetical protein